MNKIVVGIIGILLLVGTVFISGCISTTSNSGKVLYDSDVQSDTTTIFVPIDKQAVQVIITDAKSYSSYGSIKMYPSVNIYNLDVNGVEGQNVGNYLDNIKGQKSLELSNINNGTLDFKAGSQCLGIVVNQVGVHIKVVTV